MQKREFLSSVLGKSSSRKKSSLSSMSGLSPYAGPWTKAQAKHLASRTMFGHTFQQLNTFEALGLEGAIEMLFRPIDVPSPPTYGNYNGDPNAGPGEVWVDQLPAPGANTARKASHRVWILSNIFNEENSILEKMILFWHEHIPIFNMGTAYEEYVYSLLLRKNAIGNFRTLIEEITVNPAMLRYLNGNDNARQAPNENYARELLELFTVGRGPEAGPGDYTHYTEQDVFAIARALTGWRTSRADYFGPAEYIRNRHDLEDKQLSERFGNIVITNQEENEYKVVIDIILQQRQTAVNLIKQLHIWFIGSDISPEADEAVVQPLAQMLIDNDYDLEPILKTLLSSEYFFDENHRGCIISSPLDITLKFLRAIEFPIAQNGIPRYNTINSIKNFISEQGMEFMEIPEVAGWKAYYQVPQFSKFWINSFTLGQREIMIDFFLAGNNTGRDSEVNLIDLVESLGEIANDPNDLIYAIGELVFPFTITDQQLNGLKEVLIPGLPDYEWTIEYTDYLADKENDELRTGIERRLRQLFISMFKMPEFHLI